MPGPVITPSFSQGARPPFMGPAFSNSIAPLTLRCALDTFIFSVSSSIKGGVTLNLTSQQQTDFLHLNDLIRTNTAAAPAFLKNNPQLVHTIKKELGVDAHEFMPARHGREAMRVKRFFRLDPTNILPRILYDPATPITPSSVDELDDVDIARFALDLKVRERSLDDEFLEVAHSFEHGGKLYARLVSAVEREVLQWPDLFVFRNPAAILQHLYENTPHEPVSLYRYAGLSHVEEFLNHGYDEQRTTEMEFAGLNGVDQYEEHYGVEEYALYYNTPGAYFFRASEHREELPSAFRHYGLCNITDGIVSQIEHSMPVTLLLTYLAAANGAAYMTPMEFASMSEGTRLLNKLLQTSSDVSTKIHFHTFPTTEQGSNWLQRLHAAGASVYMSLGEIADLSDNSFLKDVNKVLLDFRSDSSEKDKAWMIINSTTDHPRGAVGTDEANEESFLFTLLEYPSADARELIEVMLEENEEMAERAQALFISIPAYSLQFLKRWEKEWENKSPELSRFLDTTISTAEDHSKKYHGKTFEQKNKL